MNDARQVLDRAITEREFQNQVVQLARLHGYRVHHHYDSRRSEPGWPDLVMVHETESCRPIIIAELKAEKGRLSPAQQFWMERLDCGEVFEDYIVVRVWRPSMWDEIESLLSRQNRGREIA